MTEKNETQSKARAWELSVGWDHPIVKAGLVPAHLAEQAFGCSENTFRKWCTENPTLVRQMNSRYWVHIDALTQWFREPVGTKGQRTPREQPKNNRKGVKRAQE